MKWPIIATLALLTACGESVQGAPEPGGNIALPPIEWRVRDRVALEQAYRDSGMGLTDRENLHGFAGYADDGTAVVYTLPPQRVDDAVACTLGHEIMHVALGEYHR